MSGIGTFSEYAVVHENSVVPVGDWYPLEAVSLCSCGVATGWGSAVNVADVRAGDTVVVIGTGGIGVNAVQGAAMAGAANVIAVDPVEMKREFAQTVGATHAVASIEEAGPLVQELSWGRGANAVLLTVGTATYSSWEAWFDCAPAVADEMAALVGDAIFVNGMAGLAAFVEA